MGYIALIARDADDGASATAKGRHRRPRVDGSFPAESPVPGRPRRSRRRSAPHVQWL